MKKSEMVLAVSERTEIAKADVTAILDALAAVALEELKAGKDGDRIIIPDIVVLKKKRTKATPAKTGRNPRTGEAVKIPAKKAGWKVLARPAKVLKDAV